MLKSKRGASIISLALCAISMILVTTAIVIATNNSAMYRAHMALGKTSKMVEISAYTKVYKLNEVTNIAKQAFANNYLSYYDGEVDLDGFEALVIGDMMQQIPLQQLEDYSISIMSDGVDVKHK